MASGSGKLVQRCRCNRTGLCRRCPCVKDGQQCSSCLLSKLGFCLNVSTPSTTHTAFPAIQSVPKTTLTTATNSMSTQPSQSLVTPQSSTSAPSISDLTPTITQNNDVHVLERPSFEELKNQVFTWGTLSAADFAHALEATYSEVVHWRKNSFCVPFSKDGKEFVHELSRLFSAFAYASSMESITLELPQYYPFYSCKNHIEPRKQKNTRSLLRRGSKSGRKVT